MNREKYKKKQIAIIFGGKSVEHEVSIQSAFNIVEALDKNKYDVSLIGITKKGVWKLVDLLKLKETTTLNINNRNDRVSLVPQGDGELFNVDKLNKKKFDVVIPILHGPFGEDGTIQGLLKLANVPFVGAGVLGSAIGMDKDVSKRLLKEAGISIAKFKTYYSHQKSKIKFNDISKELGVPFFIKPANLGSSVGVNEIKNNKEFKIALDKAFEYDNKIIFEEKIIGREIECSVLGNDNPIASVAGEIIPDRSFYTYEAKYIDKNGATLKIPADLSDKIKQDVKDLSIKVFNVLECQGMARVDFFLKSDGGLVVNEINTIPGFTSISMYPKLWEYSGVSYSKLIDTLIDLAIERFQKEQKLKTSYI